MLTMGLTAKHGGISKATLTRAFRGGRISANKNAKGGCDSAMMRTAPLASTKVESPQRAVLMARLDAEIDWLKAQTEHVKLMRKQLDKMKVHSEKWQDQAQSAQRLSTDIRPQRRSWFGIVKAIWPPKWLVPSQTMRADERFWGWRRRIGQMAGR